MKKLQFAVKRSVDVVLSLLAIVVLLPVFFLVALAIKSTSVGPALYTQTRVGKNNKEFQILKFRTMVVNSAFIRNGLAVKKNDTRITSVGHFLRKTSLDEIPQFLNVLRGDISIVGPRPGLPEQVIYLDQRQLMRTAVRPGITGLATVNGRAAIPWSKRIEYDLLYIEKFSLWLDFTIMVRSVWVVISGQNTYFDGAHGPAFDLANPDDLPQSRKKQ
jgi:lipopolysaccharide/colanic/teichoic acid biosynthesis glycosyltransferase